MKIKEGYFEEEHILQNAPEAGLSEISGVPVLDQKQVLAAAQAVYPQVQKWVSEFPVILPARIPSVCLACAAMCPDQPLDVIATVSEFSLTMFAFDDIIDGALDDLSDDELEVVLNLYGTVVTAQEPLAQLGNYDMAKIKPWIQVALALFKISQELAAYPSAKWHYRFYARRISQVVETMRKELHWRQGRETTGFLSTYDEYVKNGRESIGRPTVLSVVLTMVGPEPEKPFSEMVEILDHLVLTAGASTRLSNDLRSFGREKAENKPNSVLILMEGGLSEKESEKYVISDVNNYLTNLHGLVQLLPESYQIWGRYCERLSWFSKDWYLVREFHQFKPEELRDLSQKVESKS